MAIGCERLRLNAHGEQVRRVKNDVERVGGNFRDGDSVGVDIRSISLLLRKWWYLPYST